MLTKKDLEQLDEILKNRIRQDVSEIVRAQIRQDVPAIVSKQIRQDVPEIVRAQIRQDVPEIVKMAFQDFYDNVFEPYANKNEREHEQMINEIKAIRKDTEEIKGHVKDHEKRITHLENVASVNN